MPVQTSPPRMSDAFAALAWAGMSAAYDPRPLVYHHHGRKTAAELDRLTRGYDAGRGAYYAKYLLRRRSAIPYLKGWGQAARCEFSGRRTVPHTRREAASAVRYLVSRLYTRPQDTNPPPRVRRHAPKSNPVSAGAGARAVRPQQVRPCCLDHAVDMARFNSSARRTASATTVSVGFA